MKRMKELLFRTIIIVAIISGCSSRESVHQIGTLQPETERFWEVVPRETVVERIGIDFGFTEGPAWHPGGFLLLSDIPANTIYQFNGRKFPVFRRHSNNANGLLVEPDGSLLACEHGSRSITRFTADGKLTTLADRYQGKRLNSPNDLCRKRNGTIYFTDPPWGLSGRNNDPEKELPYSGVFRLLDGRITLLDSTLSWPNGIALSPDEKYLYVANMETESENGREKNHLFWIRYTLDESGDVLDRAVFFTATDSSLPGGPDGMTVDKRGNLFLTGPGGILVVDSAGEHLGTIGIPVPASNLVFGPKGDKLYVTARTTVLRIEFK